jgi:crotonobetainyl-CoA:carnitine CoA-transferase CaiB-like acyl-CoA transferase
MVRDSQLPLSSHAPLGRARAAVPTRLPLMIPLLRDVRLLEIGSVVLGPYAAQILADLGADVVKVEPMDGDIARASQPRSSSMGALFANNNRNKRVIAIDLKRPEAKDVLARLVARSDVLLHNMRANAAERLGIDFQSAAEINPRLVYCAAVGFGQGGRYRDQPAFDDTVQAASGLAMLLRDADGAPRFVPTILADKVTALHAVYGILAALVARANGRAGAIQVEVPMFEVFSAFLLNEHLGAATFATDGRVGYDRVLSNNRRPFRTSDGWIAVLPYTAEQWRRFLGEIGRQDIMNEAWFANAAERQGRLDWLYGVIAAALPSRTTESWLTAFARLQIPASRVNRLEDLLHDPHLDDVGFFDVPAGYPQDVVRMIPQPVRFDGVPPYDDRPPQPLSADTRDVLRECGYADDAIDRFVSAGVAGNDAHGA